MKRRFERRNEKLLSNKSFLKRLLTFIFFAIVTESLIIFMGAIGFHLIEGLSWIDSPLNTAMIITGNGPPFEPHTYIGKIFQIGFSLIGVIIFVLIVSVVLAPVFHRVLHSFHVDSKDNSQSLKDGLK